MSATRIGWCVSRLSAKAVDAHWRVSRKELVMKREWQPQAYLRLVAVVFQILDDACAPAIPRLSKTLKSTLFLAAWRGTEAM